jgi:hypothetical protein
MLLLLFSLFSGLQGTIVSMLRLGGIKGGIVNCGCEEEKHTFWI